MQYIVMSVMTYEDHNLKYSFKIPYNSILRYILFSYKKSRKLYFRH